MKTFRELIKREINESISKKIWDEVTNATEIEAEEMVHKNWKKFTPEVINKGFCDIFADNLEAKLSGVTQWTTDEGSDGSGTFGHTWIEYKGKFYDAEVPKGVKTYYEIPFIIRSKKLQGEFPTDIRKL